MDQAIRVIFAVLHSQISAISLRSLMSTILVFAVFLGPYSFAGDSHAQEHQSQSSMGHHDNPTDDDHSTVEHALTHCGSGACAPPFVRAFSAVALQTAGSHRLHLSFGDDAMLRALILDCDPPVPRDGFSVI